MPSVCRRQCVSAGCATDCSVQAQGCEGVNTLALLRSCVRVVPMSSDVSVCASLEHDYSTATVLRNQFGIASEHVVQGTPSLPLRRTSTLNQPHPNPKSVRLHCSRTRQKHQRTPYPFAMPCSSTSPGARPQGASQYYK